MIVGLGSNIGSREAFLRAALALLVAAPGIELRAVSRVFETEPVGPPQPSYLNAAARLDVAPELGGEALLDRLLGIERELGRVRRERYGPRTIDLDVLFWDGPAVAGPRLTVPHPRLLERAFALAPLLDVAPELTPRFGPALAAVGGAPSDARPLNRGPVAVQTRGPAGSVLEATGRDLPDALASAAAIAAGAASGGQVPKGALQNPADHGRGGGAADRLRAGRPDGRRGPLPREVLVSDLGTDRARGLLLAARGPRRTTLWPERFQTERTPAGALVRLFGPAAAE